MLNCEAFLSRSTACRRAAQDKLHPYLTLNCPKNHGQLETGN